MRAALALSSEKRHEREGKEEEREREVLICNAYFFLAESKFSNISGKIPFLTELLTK